MEYSLPDSIMSEMESNTAFNEQGVMDQRILTAIAATPVDKGEEELPDPIDYLKEVMGQRGLCNKDLMAYIGSSGNVCSILKRRRPLTIRMIRNLHKYLHIPAKILIQPYSCH